MNYPHRGEIFYISRAGAYNEIGSEQYAGRPAIIVSSDKINQNSETLEIVYLTTQPKRDLPTHVTVRASGRVSTAICEQVTTVSSTRIGDYYGECNSQELSAVDAAIASSLGLEFVAPENCATESGGGELSTLDEKYIELRSEKNLYKSLYESTLEKLLERRE